jgi:SecD/SecF fusion protein
MRDTPLWKPLLILVVLVGSVLALYPPATKLKPGLDLAGGTTLIYEVELPDDAHNPKQVLDDTIAVLRDRVDPQGVRNLIWRVQGASRVEIQMPLAPQETTAKRQAATTAREALLAQNISEAVLDAALRLTGSQRETEMDRLAAGSAVLRQNLGALTTAQDALAAVQGPYFQAQKAQREAAAALAALPADADGEPKKQMREHAQNLLDQLIPLAQQLNAARTAFDTARAQVLESNLGGDELEAVFSLYDPSSSNTRAREAYDKAMAKLIERHPQHGDALRAAAAAHAAYTTVKGPLDDPNDLIAMLRGSGVLEFRIAANKDFGPANANEFRDLLRERGPRAGGDQPWRWFALDDVEQFADSPAGLARLQENAEEFFTARGLVGAEYGGKYYVLLSNTHGSSLRQEDEGWELTRVTRSRDDYGFAAVAFQLNSVGGALMGELTGGHRQQPMAIVLDGRIISAPNINDRITGNGIITGGQGGFSAKELDYLIRTLGAGSLQARLSENPVSVKTTGPQIGQDNLRAGLDAAIWSLVIVGGFMLVYYFFWGVLANFALLFNILIILGVMAMLEATFTLPGIAGIVLTIGMAVDANVLIYERIREELERKMDLSTAIRLGYDKAMSSIVDSNLTTLITCIVLGYTATADVKGFAVTLGIGILATLFTAVFATRVIVAPMAKYLHPQHVTMLPMVAPAVRKAFAPNIDWMGLRYVFYTLSGALMIAGVVMMIARGGDMLDIEFRGGTQVGVELAQGKTMTLADARARLTQAAAKFNIPQLAGERAQVTTVGKMEAGQAEAFTIAVVAQPGSEADRASDVLVISDAVKSAFADAINTSQPIDFAGLDAQRVGAAPAYIVRDANLGAVINRPGVNVNVQEYLGGAAIRLDNLSPAATLDDLTRRIRRMREQPAYEKLGYRQFTVIGLDRAAQAQSVSPGSASDAPGSPDSPAYDSVVVLVRDSGTNYAEAPESFTDKGGLADSEWNLIRDALQRDTSLASVTSFSPQVSDTMKQNAIAAIALSLLAVVAYIWFRFGSLRYGIAAIAALVHDVTIAMGMVAICGFLHQFEWARLLLLDSFKIDLALIAAMLTLIGYSLNDTIIVFDRIRENRGRLAFATPAIINDSINQTISRTVITSGTTLMAIVVLYLIGGPGVHGFAFAMMIGVIVGTYSSIAIASPLLMSMATWAAKRAAAREARAPGHTPTPEHGVRAPAR